MMKLNKRRLLLNLGLVGATVFLGACSGSFKIDTPVGPIEGEWHLEPIEPRPAGDLQQPGDFQEVTLLFAEDDYGGIKPVVTHGEFLYMTEFSDNLPSVYTLLRPAQEGSGLPRVTVNDSLYEHAPTLGTPIPIVLVQKAQALAQAGYAAAPIDENSNIPFNYDEVGDTASITFYIPEISASQMLPSPFLFPATLAQELLLVDGIIIKRIEGSRADVALYAQTVGLSSVDIDDPFGGYTIPKSLIDSFISSISPAD